MAEKKTRIKKNTVFRFALLVLLAYVIVMAAQLTMQINEKKAELAALDEKIVMQTQKNEDLQQRSQNSDLYLEQKARENGYARPGESIYREIPNGDVTN